MAPPLSGTGPFPPSTGGATTGFGAPLTLMPARQSIPLRPVDKISSTSTSRSGSTSADVVTVQGSKIGQPNDAASASDRTAAFTSANNSTSAGTSQLTKAQVDANLLAVENRKKGVLGCIGRDVNNVSQPCDPCDTIDCLTKLLTGNLLDLDAKKLLCDTMNNTEKALKRQIDSTGDALLSAAQNLTSAQALKAPLQTLNSFLNKIDPGAVAKCFGAQNVIDNAKGQLNKVNKIISDAEKGVHDKLAEKFNKATEAAQQFSITPSTCNNKGPPASIRSLI